MVSIDVSGRADMSHYTTLADEVRARCDACGCNWTYQRHEALFCPMCAARFTMAYMSSTSPVTYVDFGASGGATHAVESSGKIIPTVHAV